MSDSTLVPSAELEAILREVGAPNSAEYQNLHSVISSSPILTAQLNEAVKLRAVERGGNSVQERLVAHFAFLPEDENATGSYDPETRTISIRRSELLKPDLHDNLTFTLGHETRHALNHPEVSQAEQQFKREIYELVRNGQPQAEAAPLIERAMTVLRRDEGLAEIGGWNAFASRKHKANPAVTLGEIIEKAYDAGRFIDKNNLGDYSLKPGFTLNDDLSLSPTGANLQAAEKYYYDRSPDELGLGPFGRSDYTNLYGKWYVGITCLTTNYFHSPEQKLVIDMERLGFDQELLEENGLDFRDNKGSGDRCTYYTPQEPDIPRHFEHTADRLHQPPEPERDSVLEPHELPQRQFGESGIQPELMRRQAEPAPTITLTPRQQQWSDAIEAHSGDKLRAMGLSAVEIENVKAAGIRDMQLKCPDKEVMFAGINQQNPDKPYLVLATGANFDCPLVDIEAARRQPAQETMQAMALQMQQPDREPEGLKGPGR